MEDRSSAWRGRLDEALNFWERGRIAYNGVLAVVSLAALPSSGLGSVGWTVTNGALLVVLVAAANLLYCAAYAVDLPMQASSHAPWWRRVGRRLVWALGTLLGSALAVVTIAAITRVGLP